MQVEEISSADGAHYYDELPCNIKKDDRTGENTNEDPSVCA